MDAVPRSLTPVSALRLTLRLSPELTMNRPLTLLLLLLGLTLTRAAGAQVIRGTVEDSTGMPLNDVRVSVIAATSDSVIREARSGNAGDFSINAGRGGKYRVRLNRIGYAQQTSNVIDLLPLQIVTLRLKMVIAVQLLTTVTVVERRNVTLNELMSASGFDLRQNKYPMNALDAEQLEAEGGQTLEALFWIGRLPGVSIVDDTLGHSLRMTNVVSGARGYCFPEVYLDARLLSAEATSAEAALAFIGGLQTNMLHGLEVYRGQQLPPPSLAGQFGTQSDVKPCGVVAVWTKAARERALTAERAKGDGSIQVVRGKVIDFDTGRPIPNAVLTLKSEMGADLEKPVTADSNGVFSIHTRQYQRLKIGAVGGGYVDLVTPALAVELEEMLTVDVILSTHHRPIAPVALRARELARLYSATDSRGIGFRRRRGIAGTFFDAAEISKSGARTLAELVRQIPNVSDAAGGPDAEAIMFRMPPPAPAPRAAAIAAGVTTSCKPMYFLNGELQREPDNTVRPLMLSQLYAVEVYPLASEVPYIYRMGSTGCGILGVWTKDVVK